MQNFARFLELKLNSLTLFCKKNPNSNASPIYTPEVRASRVPEIFPPLQPYETTNKERFPLLKPYANSRIDLSGISPNGYVLTAPRIGFL
jgi:hypothetical protein